LLHSDRGCGSFFLLKEETRAVESRAGLRSRKGGFTFDVFSVFVFVLEKGTSALEKERDCV